VVKLNQLRDLIAVVDCGSLRTAAAKLGVTATALSKSLSALEDELHVQLLVRHSRGISVTPHGHAFLARARRIASESQKALEEMAQLRGEGEGTITMGTSPTPSLVLLPGVLADFRREYPQVKLAIRGGLYDGHVAAIREGSMDLAIGPVPVEMDSTVAHEALFYNHLVVAARRGHPMAGPGSRTLAELAACEWILTSSAEHGPGAAILDAYAQHGVAPPRRLIRCDITWALPALLAGTDCLCALPQPLMAHPPLGSTLATVTVHETLPRYPVCLIHRADTPLLPAAAHLAALIRRHAHYHASAHPELVITP